MPKSPSLTTVVEVQPAEPAVTASQNNPEQFSMVEECVNSYHAKRQADGSLDIAISVPRRFAGLWLVKLSELRATEEDIREYEPPADTTP